MIYKQHTLPRYADIYGDIDKKLVFESDLKRYRFPRNVDIFVDIYIFIWHEHPKSGKA